MTSVRQQLVEEYLRRLDSASAVLEPQRRAELRAEIREHIEAATDEVEVLDATAVRAILERLGSPEEIVSAEQGPTPTESATPMAHPAPPDSAPAVASTTGRSNRKVVVIGVAAALLGCFLALAWWALQSSQPNDAMHQPSGPAATSTP